MRSKGYVNKNGTYVEPSRRTAPDKARANNWSSKGQVNPYTGKKGTVNRTSRRCGRVGHTGRGSLDSVISAPDAPRLTLSTVQALSDAELRALRTVAGEPTLPATQRKAAPAEG